MNTTLERSAQAVFAVVGRGIAKLMPDRVPVVFAGSAAVEDLCESIGHRGLHKALVVSDASLVELGIVERITDALTAAGVDSAVYAEIEPDPTFPQVEAGFDRYRDASCDSVVAVGGGSPMDAAKMIAALATNGRPLSKLEGKFRVRKPPAPLFAVPTTAGTGSEVTVAAVVSDPDTHTKKFFLDPKLLPEMAALDPGLMTGLPPRMTAATGMDALTHAVESFISKTSTSQTEAYATTAVRLVFDHLPTAYADGNDLGARRGMALASFYVGLAFTRTSVGYVHAIAHNLGAEYGTPHGLANAIALPLVLDFSEESARPQLARLGELVGVDGRTESDRAPGFIQAVRDLMTELDIPATLDSLRAEDVPTIATRARAEAFLDYPVPRFMEQPDCERVLRRMLSDP